MRKPKFLKDVRVSSKARETMEKGTKFLNEKIDEELTSKDLLGCMVLAYEMKWSFWSMQRLHGIYNRRRMAEERGQLLAY